PYWKDENNLLIPSKEGLQSFDVTKGKGKIIRPVLEEEKSVIHTVNKAMSVNNIGRYAFFQKEGDLWAYDIQKNIDLYIEPIPDNSFLEAMRTSANGEQVVFYKKKKED